MSTQSEVINEDKKRPKFLNVKELAEMLRLKTRTIYDMVSQGRIPYRKAEDRTIFLLDEIWSGRSRTTKIPKRRRLGKKSSRDKLFVLGCGHSLNGCNSGKE